MLSTATRSAVLMDLSQSEASQDFHGLIHNPGTSAGPSSGSVPLKLEEQTKTPYHQVPHGEEPDPDVPSSKRKRRRIGDKAVMQFMQSRLAALNPKPVAQFDGKNVVNVVSTSNEFECTACHKTFPTHQALGGHRSSHYVRDENDPKQVNHVCEVCQKSFPSGQALGGHKRFHYKGPLILKHKAPSTTASSMPALQEISPSHPTVCVKLFGVDIKKAQEDKKINLDLTL